MAETTNIQWGDSTVNAVMGCRGCELFPIPTEVLEAIDLAVRESGVAGFASRPIFKRLVDECFERIEEAHPGHKRGVNTTNIWHLRERFGIAVEEQHGIEAKEAALDAIERAVTCYAAKLHLNKGASIVKPERKPKAGYAPIFEQVTHFSGRVAEMAKKPDLLSRADPASPWKERLPRLVFVSDMGDAFSRRSDFDFLEREVMEPILSDAGRRHLWLWLTKRPELMAEFATRIGGFPENVCAMTTVTGPEVLGRVDDLRKVDAKIRGLSLEPLWERIPPAELDLEGIDWVIVGGESGAKAHAREFPLEWVEELREHCRESGVALFVKQLGRNPSQGGEVLKLGDSHGGDWEEWEEELRVREFPQAFHEYRKNEMTISNEPRPSPKKGKKKHGLTKEEAADFRRLDKKVRKGLEAYVEAGVALAEIHERKLWKAGGHATWQDYCKDVAGMSRVHAHRLMQAARISVRLAETLPVGNTEVPVLPQSESQVRPLARLKDEAQQAKAWQVAAERAGGTPTEREVKEAVVELLAPEAPGEPIVPARERRRALVGQLREAFDARSWEQVEEALAGLEEVVG